MLHLKKIYKLFFLSLFAFSCINVIDEKKNVIIILADDLGYSDLGCFGSEINTPNIDKLASEGTIFTNYYSSPLCAPSRAMLLSGNDNHISGIGIQAYKSDNFGYEGVLSDRVVIIPELLQENGYKTFMSGKWHIGDDPINRGFHKTFALIPGAFTHYDNNKPIKGYPDSAFSENGKRKLWTEGKYSTDYYTDKMIEFIDSSNGDTFFGYLSYTAPHWPLQVSENFSDKYRGYYDGGYEKIKLRRFNNLKSKGFIPEDLKYPKFENSYKKWNELNDREKKVESRKMEIYAGMIDNLDYNVGRLIKYLKDSDQFDKTIIIFISDNGAAGEDFYYNETYGPYIQEKFSYDYDLMGTSESFVSLGKAWADVITFPFKLYKGFTTSGGMRSPLIISGLPEKKYSSTDQFITLVDIAPSIYNVLNINYPKRLNNKEIHKLSGESILPYLFGKKENVHDDGYIFSFEHSGNSVLFKNNWKIVNKTSPFNRNNFELYHMSDISEMYDMKKKNSKIFSEMLYDWESYVVEKKLIFPTPYIDNLN